MKNIKVLGSCNCQCKGAFKAIEKAVKELKLDASITTETDVMTLIKYGIMSGPAVVIDDKVVHLGDISDNDEIKKWFE